MALIPFPVLIQSCLYEKATGELGLALLLALSRRAVAADRACRAGDWGFRERSRTREGGCRLVYNSSVLVVGHGAVGRHVSRALRAMGSRVMATRRTLAEKEGRPRIPDL